MTIVYARSRQQVQLICSRCRGLCCDQDGSTWIHRDWIEVELPKAGGDFDSKGRPICAGCVGDQDMAEFLADELFDRDTEFVKWKTEVRRYGGR